MSNQSLNKLLRRSISKKVTDKTFISLYHQWNERLTIQDNEYLTDLLEINTNNSVNYIDYQTNLVIRLSVSSVDELNRFWLNFRRLSEINQLHYLMKLNKFVINNGTKIPEDICKDLVNVHFNDYTLSFINKLNPLVPLTPIQLSLVHQIIFFWSTIVDNLINCLQVDNFSKLISFLKDFKLTSLLKFLSKSKQMLSTSDLQIESIVPIENHKSVKANVSVFKNVSLLNLNPKRLLQISNIKKYIWLNQVVKSWNFQNDSQFLDRFVNNFARKNKKKPYFVSSDLISSLFNGLFYSVVSKEADYMIFNWKNFIITRLPTVLSNLNFSDTKETLEDAISDAFSSLEGSVMKVITNLEVGSSSNYDLRQAFIKSCIYNELIPIQSIHKFFPLDAKMSSQLFIHEMGQFKSSININQQFDEKLLNINCEFTSLEESGLIKFINSLPPVLEYSSTAQIQLSSIILKIIDDLLIEKDNEKLSRLLLSILNNIQVLNFICFNSKKGPHSILTKLINYIDEEDFNIDDEDSFQDLYSYFGVIILGIISIIEFFNIDYSKFSVKNSYSIDYIGNFYYRLCDCLTNNQPKDSNEDDTTIIANYNSLLNDWINALFDDNNEGLSDDLFKSVNVKQIYKMIPIIYQQSIIAINNGKIDFKTLNNGIDYLSQVFLIPCTLSIINWLLKQISIKNELESIPVKVLHVIIKSNFGNGEEQELNNESILIFRVVLKISGSSIISTLKKLTNWSSSDQINEIIGKVSKTLEPNSPESINSKIAIDHDKNLCEQFKLSLINLVNNNDDNDFHFICGFLNINENDLIGFLIEEIISYQKSNNEETKVFINLAIYIILIESIGSSDEKQYWMNQLSLQKIQRVEDNKSVDQQFNLSMDYHYSSIFNDPTNQKDDDDDDLFNDKPTSFSIVQFEMLQQKVKRFNSLLYQFNLIKSNISIEDQSNYAKSVNTLKDRFIDELGSLFM